MGGRIFFRIVGDDGDFLHAFGMDLIGDGLRGQSALMALAAGHRHRVIEQNFVGHRRAGGDGEAHGE